MTPNPILAAVLHPMPGVDTETLAERAMDRLDRRYMRGEITGPEYEAACKALDAWVRES